MKNNELISFLKEKRLIYNKKLNSRIEYILKNNYNNVLTEIYEKTDFLLCKSFKERIYCIENNISSKVLCTACKENPVMFVKGKYQTFCSNKCSSSYEITKKKTLKTNLKRYGVKHPLCLDEYKEKQIKTNIEKYGVDSPNKSDDIMRKRMTTNIEKYGTEHYLKTKEFKNKSKETKKRKYGNGNYNNRKKAKETNFKKYNVEHPLQNSSISEKVKSANISKYGNSCSIAHIQKDLNNKRKETFILKYDREYSSQKNISKYVLVLLNNYDWMYLQHIIKKKSLVDISKYLKVNPQTVSNYLSKLSISIQNYGYSSGENNLAEFIQYLNINFLNNCRDIISPYELDIFIPDKNIAIEYCGLYWHSEAQGKDKNYHANKLKMCQEKGIRLITIFEDEWIHRQEQVKSKLKSILGIDDREKLFARKCEVVSLSKSQKSKFFEQNHIQGNGPGSISYGLEYEKEIVAAITFIDQKQGKFTLNRYATSKHVVGGFSKLLDHFKRNHEWKEVITFADLRWSLGELYEKCGFKLDKILKPDYEYVERNMRIHKFNYRHKNLQKKLKNYDPNLSEKKNCDNNKILRIWDCGKKRYILKNTF